MKVKYFKEKMNLVHGLLMGWRNVTSEDLRRREWADYVRTAAMTLSNLANEMERDVAKGNK